MKIVGIIPARYQSSRLPGKPILDINGKPMIWWVYNQCKKIEDFAEIYVATDDNRIKEKCEYFGIPVLMTSPSHPTHVDRIHEVSKLVNSELYVVVCGDEPLINSETIKSVIPTEKEYENRCKYGYVGALCRYFDKASEVLDPANIKIVTNNRDECILLSRAPIPFPYKTVLFKYKKTIGVECYNKAALEFFANTPKGQLEMIEDVTLQRFLENKIHIKYKLVDLDSLSVDTERDLEKVRKILTTNLSI